MKDDLIARSVVVNKDQRLAEMVPTWATMLPLTGFDIRLISLVRAWTAFSIPRSTSIGFAPAATFFATLPVDRLGEDGGRRGAITGQPQTRNGQ
jgi:hypothetical protein